MRDPLQYITEKLILRRPRRALLFGCELLGVSALRVRAAQSSPLYSPDGGEFFELPADRIIARSVLDRGCWQPEAMDFIARHVPGGDCILIDIGANVGLVTRQLVHKVPNIVAAVCFEPHPGNFQMLERNLAHLPQCHCVQAAVSNSAGQFTFYEDTHNAGNYSLSPDAVRRREYRTSIVTCIQATPENLLAPLTDAQRALPIVWKSDAQGFDEVIVTALPDSFWSRVHCGVMEFTRIERPTFERERLRAILESYPIRRFRRQDRNATVEEIMTFSEGRDAKFHDLFFSR